MYVYDPKMNVMKPTKQEMIKTVYCSSTLSLKHTCSFSTKNKTIALKKMPLIEKHTNLIQIVLKNDSK